MAFEGAKPGGHRQPVDQYRRPEGAAGPVGEHTGTAKQGALQQEAGIVENRRPAPVPEAGRQGVIRHKQAHVQGTPGPEAGKVGAACGVGQKGDAKQQLFTEGGHQQQRQGAAQQHPEGRPAPRSQQEAGAATHPEGEGGIDPQDQAGAAGGAPAKRGEQCIPKPIQQAGEGGQWRQQVHGQLQDRCHLAAVGWRLRIRARAPSARRSSSRCPSWRSVATEARAARNCRSCSITPAGSPQRRRVLNGAEIAT